MEERKKAGIGERTKEEKNRGWDGEKEEGKKN